MGRKAHKPASTISIAPSSLFCSLLWWCEIESYSFFQAISCASLELELDSIQHVEEQESGLGGHGWFISFKTGVVKNQMFVKQIPPLLQAIGVPVHKAEKNSSSLMTPAGRRKWFGYLKPYLKAHHGVTLTLAWCVFLALFFQFYWPAYRLGLHYLEYRQRTGLGYESFALAWHCWGIWFRLSLIYCWVLLTPIFLFAYRRLIGKKALARLDDARARKLVKVESTIILAYSWLYAVCSIPQLVDLIQSGRLKALVHLSSHAAIALIR